MTERPAHDEDCELRAVNGPTSIDWSIWCACSYRASLVKLERENERLKRVEKAARTWLDARGHLYKTPRPEGAEKVYHLAVDELYRALERP